MGIRITQTFNTNHKGVKNIVMAEGLLSEAEGMVVFMPSPQQHSLYNEFHDVVLAFPALGIKLLGTGLDPRTPNLDEIKLGDIDVLRKAMDRISRVVYFIGDPEKMRQLVSLAARISNQEREPLQP